MIRFREVQAGDPSARESTRRRLPDFFGAPDALERIAALRVIVIGCGSIGLNLVHAVARLGVATISCVDRGRFKPESVETHPIDRGSVGQKKAWHAGRVAKSLSPNTAVFVCDGDVEQLGLEHWSGDLVLLATDNLDAELCVSRKARLLGLPLFQGSVHGPTLVAEVRAFSSSPDGPCVACTYSADEWKLVGGHARFSCSGEPLPSSVPATMSTSSLCALAASMTMNRVLRFALRAGTAADDTSTVFCGFNDRVTTTRLRRSVSCPEDHITIERRAVAGLSSLTVAELLAEAGLGDDVSLSVQGHRLTTLQACGCGPVTDVLRFFESASALVCPACNQNSQPHPFRTHDRVAGTLLAGIHSKSLGEMGAAKASFVLVRNHGRAVLLSPTVH